MAATILRLTIMLSLIGTELCQIRSAGQAFRPFLFPSQIEQWHLDEISAGKPMPCEPPTEGAACDCAGRQATAPQRHGNVGPHLEQVAFRADTGLFRPPLTFRNCGRTFMPAASASRVHAPEL